MNDERRVGIAAALGAALLFGGGTPIAKVLLATADPWLLAGLLYLGSGIGLALLRPLTSGRASPRLNGTDWIWLAASTLTGGMLAPTLLMVGLSAMPASGASLLLNTEGVFTALLAWFVFRENVDRRVALGMAAIVAGGFILSWPGEARFTGALPALAILGACLMWSIDNNLTRKISLSDASFIAMAKGLIAGATNLTLALLAGAHWPEPATAAGACLLGFASYGASLTLFVIGLRQLGTARTAAYFSVAPFFGAALAIILLREPLTNPILMAGMLMALGVALHLMEQHEHEHVHDAQEHAHPHTHGVGDDHHEHDHLDPLPPGTRHTHPHRHRPMAHSHPHFPDAHHRHDHD